MKKQYILLVGLGLFILSFSAKAQNQTADTANYPYWIEMMKDPNANFFETQKAFNIYWENREITKGSGYTQFKRWEAKMENKVDANGNRRKNIDLYNAVTNYQNHKALQKASTAGNWTQMGPFNPPPMSNGQPRGLGRIASLAFDPLDANTMYTGTASGGIWKTIDGGNNWTNISNNLPSLGVSAIIVTNSYILIGTGDRDNNDADGIGVMKSTDGGLTWLPSSTGMGNRTVHRMVLDPTNNNTIITATSSGIYRSTDAGATWSLRQAGNTYDLVFKPNDSNTLYAAITGAPTIVKSTDNGQTWNALSTGFTPAAVKAAIAVTPDDPDYLYVVTAESGVFSGLYRSTDAGASFALRANSPNLMSSNSTGSGTSGHAWYNLDVAVDPTNKNVVYVGGVNIFKSTNGGSTWTINGHWTGFGTSSPTVHADNHILKFSPLNGKLYTGNDGGVYETSNGGVLWTIKSNGLNIGQIYKIGQSTLNKDLILAGYQDNGTSRYNAGSWAAVAGGDGMECIIDPTNTNFMYAETQRGNVLRSTNGGLFFFGISGNIPGEGTWVTPYILDEADQNTMYVGYSNLWRNDDVRNTENWTQITSLTGSSTIRVIEQSSVNPDLLLFSRSDNKLYISTNATDPAPTFTQVSLPIPQRPYAIETHPTDENIIYIVMLARVYKSTNKGVTWTNITGTLPSGFNFNTIVYDKSFGGESLYLGTEAGVFYRDSTMSDWIDFSTNLPPVDITELEIYYGATRNDSRIRAATYGRGLWESDLHTNFNVSTEENGLNLTNNSVKLFPNPNTGIATINIKNSNAASVKLLITNINGQIIKTQSLTANNGFIEAVIDISNEPKGVYFVTVNDGKSSVTKEMIVN